MTNKTVWYISKYANVKKFGAETRQASFCREFAKQGYDVKLITSNSSHLFDSLPKFNGRYLSDPESGFEVIWVNVLKYSNPSSFKRILGWFIFELFVMLLPFLKKYKTPDIVIASSLSLLSVFSGCFFKFFYKSKFIFEVRDIWPQTLIDLKGVSKRHPLILLLSLIEKMGYKYADSIVGTMPGLSVHVNDVIGSNDKVHFIPQGVSLEFYESKQDSISVEYKNTYFRQDTFTVTYAGTLGVANALNYIIDAARLLELSDENIHFVLVGEGAEKENLQAQAKDLNNVTFAPGIKKVQVQSVLESSDLLIASVKHEKIYEFGISLNKFIDYMYAKKPIVCMFSGYPSMLNEAGCGEFTASEDPAALVECLLKYKKMSKEELNTLGENGYKFLVKQQNFNVLSRKYMELFGD